MVLYGDTGGAVVVVMKVPNGVGRLTGALGGRDAALDTMHTDFETGLGLGLGLTLALALGLDLARGGGGESGRNSSPDSDPSVSLGSLLEDLGLGLDLGSSAAKRWGMVRCYIIENQQRKQCKKHKQERKTDG